MNLPAEISKLPYLSAIQRPVMVTMIVITVVVFGLLSYRLLPINLMPDISYPSLTVRTEYPGAAPEEVEKAVTDVLEQSLGVVRNLVEISSSSRAEFSDILLEFNWDTDMNQATQDVREKLDLVFLPAGVKKPLILRYDPSLDPLLRIGFTCDSLSGAKLRDLIETQAVAELEKLAGVAAVRVKGGEETEINIAVDQTRLDLLNIPLESVISRLAAENINIAGGRIKEGRAEYIVRTLNEFQSDNEIANIVIHADGAKVLRLSDIAVVARQAKRVTTITRVNGKPSVEIEIFKESDANPIVVSDLVKRRLLGRENKTKTEDGKKISRRKGGGGHPKRAGSTPLKDIFTERIKIHILSDQSDFIRLAVNEVKTTALFGGILAVVVLFLFLGQLKSTTVIAVIIPISLLATFAAMHFAGVSLNVMSLGGLALGVGMLIDNAIVVSESIHRRREEGDSPELAAVTGTSIVGGAVFASTLTTVVVFFPIAFVTGVAGQLFGDMALTVIISLIVSLLTALFFLPMLTVKGEIAPTSGTIEMGWESTRLFKIAKGNLNGGYHWWRRLGLIYRFGLAAFVWIFLLLRFIFDLLAAILAALALGAAQLSLRFGKLTVPLIVKFWKIFPDALGRRFKKGISVTTEIYGRLLERALKFSGVIFALFLIIMAGMVWLLLPKLGSDLIPSVSQGVFEVEAMLSVGTPVERTAQIIAPIEEFLQNQTGVKTVSSRSGSDPERVEEQTKGPNTAGITVVLTPGGDLRGRESELIEKLRKFCANIPSLAVKISHPTLFTLKNPIEIILKGDDLDRLRRDSRAVAATLESSGQFAEIETSTRTGFPEAVVLFDRDRLARLGLTARDAAERVQQAILGAVPTQFRETDRRVDIRVQLSESSRSTLEDLRNLVINPGQPIPVLLNEVAQIVEREGPAEIVHFNSTRAARITAAPIGIDLKNADRIIKDALESMGFIEGFDYQLLGQRKEMADSLGSLQLALLLAVFLVYIVMASQFESLKYPLIILLTIPMAIALVIPALWLTRTALSIMVFLGLIVLAGIVVNNSILLVDYFNKIKADSRSIISALVNAGVVRFRPILMTSSTTILALLPMAFGTGEGAEIRRPMAVTVSFGLLFATLVTLFIIPILVKLVTRETVRPPTDII